MFVGMNRPQTSLGLSTFPSSDSLPSLPVPVGSLPIIVNSESSEYYRYNIQIRPSSVVTYRTYLGTRRVSSTRFTSTSSQDLARYSGQMTKGAVSRLSKALDCICLLHPPAAAVNPATKKTFNHSLTLITLTFACQDLVPYDTASNCLALFLKFLTRTARANDYVWKLELQKRGQIHYHIVTDALVHWGVIRNRWNRIQYNAGLISAGMDPNSTDIHECGALSNTKAYLMKYMKKDAGPESDIASLGIRKFYGCSESLQRISRPTYVLEVDCPDSVAVYTGLLDRFTYTFEVSSTVHYHALARGSSDRDYLTIYNSFPSISTLLSTFAASSQNSS